MATEERDLIRYTVPRALDDRVKARMRARGFGSITEYVRGLMRADVEQGEERDLEMRLLEGLDSSNGLEVTPEYWESRRKRLNGA